MEYRNGKVISEYTTLKDFKKIDKDQFAKLTQEKKDIIKTITISAAGDCTLGVADRIPNFNREFKKQNNDYSYFFRNVKPIFEKTSLTIVNLETTFTHATEKAPKIFNFKGDPSYAQILKEGSVNVVNLANNHMHDYLEVGYKDTIKSLTTAKIKYFGSDVFEKLNAKEVGYLNYEYKLVEEVQGIKIGLLGYKCWNNCEYVRKKIKKDLDYMNKYCELVIVSFHWGFEYLNYPSQYQKKLAHFVIDHGADLILGHHPHVIQGIETYKNKNIVYSLGNFCFGGDGNPKDKDTFIYQHTFTLKNNTLIKESNNIIPCSISSVKERNNFQPTPLEHKEKERVMSRLKQYSEKL